MSLDRVPGDAALFIGGILSMRRKEALKKANITHVVSALPLPLDRDLFEGYKHLVVEVWDVEDENILEHFPTTNAFIQEGIDSGGGVLVHCIRGPQTKPKSSSADFTFSAMGKSRSATILMAYLMSTGLSSNPQTALELIRQCRPFAEPNSGFRSQLELYYRMQCPSDPDSHPLYQRWLYQRNVEASLAAGMAPDAEEINFGELKLGEKTPSSEESSQAPNLVWRCRRCRTPVATSEYLVDHAPGGSSKHQPAKMDPIASLSAPEQNGLPSSACSHLFLDPLSWMRPELEKGLLSGRLECPNTRCGQNVGKYAWHGMKCSCGEWIVPAITIARGRVDETKSRPGAVGRNAGGKI